MTIAATLSSADRPAVELTAVADRMRLGTQRITHLSRKLTDWLAATSRRQLGPLAQDVAVPLVRLLRHHSRALQRWAALLILNSAAVRHRLRVLLIDRLTARGVYRDLSDLADCGGGAIGCLLAAALLAAKKAPTALWDWVATAISAAWVPAPNSGDATLLAALLSHETLTALKHAAPAQLQDLLDLADWLRRLIDRDGTVPPPQSPIVREWFDRAAYRGWRRHFARRYGRAAGRKRQTRLDPWLAPVAAPAGETQGIMIVEWTLAAIRSWPGRDDVLDPDDPAAAPLRTLLAHAQDALVVCDNWQTQIDWLQSGARQLLPGSIVEQGATVPVPSTTN